MALNASKIDPKSSVAMAFGEIAENAAKIGQLNITPEVLTTMLGDGHQASPAPKK
jgi:hypothetical protein